MGHDAPFYSVTQRMLDEVRRLAAQGRVRITHHVSVERAYRYGHNVRHLHHALREARSIRASQPDQASDWVVTGPDLDGDDLDLAVVVEADIVVVTVF